MSQVNEKPSLDTAPAGSIRFNTDSAKLEIYNGEQWWEIDATSPDQQTGGTRAVMGGGKLTHPARQDVIQFVTMDTTGNAVDFGDLLSASSEFYIASSRTRGIFAGTYAPNSVSNSIEFVTIASTGNATDFGGDITVARRGGHSASSSTRGIFAGGFDNSDRTNHIDFMTIASTGTNANDFGDLIQYVTMTTLGNSSDFGDLNELRGSVAAASNAVTGIYGGGGSPTTLQSIDKITLASLGNATDYGDLLAATSSFGAGASPTRIIFAGGYSPAGPSKIDVIQYKQFTSSGDTVDFGDLLGACAVPHPVTNGHGGLG